MRIIIYAILLRGDRKGRNEGYNSDQYGPKNPFLIPVRNGLPSIFENLNRRLRLLIRNFLKRGREVLFGRLFGRYDLIIRRRRTDGIKGTIFLE
jgi:hypothetical protein